MLRGPSRESFQELEMESVRAWLVATIVLSCGSVARAQIGGTGVDGPFVPTSDVTLNANATNGGIFQFTDVYIGPGIAVTCSGTLPLQVYSTGNIVIDGMPGFSPGRLVADGGAGSAIAGSIQFCPPAPGGSASNGGWPGGVSSCMTIEFSPQYFPPTP